MKLMYFGVDGVSAFQRKNNGKTKQLLEKWTPFGVGVHCYAHRLNLAYKILCKLGLFHEAGEMLKVCYAYFSHSPKKVVEFRELALLMETKCNKMLKNVKTRWISIIEPLRCLLAEYQTLMAKM